MYPTNLRLHNALGNIAATLRYLRGEFERADHLDADERSWRIAAADRALDDLAVLKAAAKRTPAPPAPPAWADAMVAAAIGSPPVAGAAPVEPFEPSPAQEYEAWLAAQSARDRAFHERVAEIND